MSFQYVLIKFALILVVFLSQSAMAQDGVSYKKGAYEVIYTTFNSSFISPKVAQTYGFVRGKDRALMNLAVIETLADGSMQSVEADVQVTVSDLIYKQQLEFKRIQEQQSVYYLAPFKISNKLDVYFEVSVKPKSSQQRLQFKFQKRLYHDGE
ncbi:MAG: DUF4426 domain-containing protein [Pseudomonadales bacterium]|nr:DUF4426 domain-containing protein [Pseudomonadales bacterium]